MGGLLAARPSTGWVCTAATSSALCRALESLEGEYAVAVVDGFDLKTSRAARLRVVGADYKSAAVAAASVVAKVVRDRLMRALASLHPEYGFEEHVGYGTDRHREALRRHGPCVLHRLSFQGVGTLRNWDCGTSGPSETTAHVWHGRANAAESLSTGREGPARGQSSCPGSDTRSGPAPGGPRPGERVGARASSGLGLKGRRNVERATLGRLESGPITVNADDANRQHYELPPEFFRLVLGPRLKYSCCYGPRPSADLAGAEEAMLALTAERAGLADGQDILDLGCGWGSLALWAAERYPRSRVVAMSNSREQGLFIAEVRESGASRTWR